MKITWKEPKSLSENCDRFKMKGQKNNTRSACPVYDICSTPCNCETAKPTDKKAKPQYAIKIRFGRRSCRYFAPFEENCMVAVVTSSSAVFCPLTRHCENACIWGPHEEKIKCKTNLSDCDHPLTAHEGMYLGKNTTRSECTGTT